MPRFMMLMIPKGYENAPAGAMPEAEAVEGKQHACVLQLLVVPHHRLDGLHPPAMGARVSFSGRKPFVTDGPFPEVKEVVGGYWMIRVGSRDEAIEWAKRCPAGDDEVIEVRQVQEMEDFPEDVREAAAGFEGMGQHRP